MREKVFALHLDEEKSRQKKRRVEEEYGKKIGSREEKDEGKRQFIESNAHTRIKHTYAVFSVTVSREMFLGMVLFARIIKKSK